jgi:glycosyltransferase involved in cell wall biosynthesis
MTMVSIRWCSATSFSRSGRDSAGPASVATMKVAWISDFPLEWLPDLPESLCHLPREHPATWQWVLLNEFEKRTDLLLHVIVLRKGLARDISFQRNNVTFHVLKVPRASRAPSLFWIDTILIRRQLHKIQPHLVHAWGTERGAGLIASRLPFPYLITVQGLLSWYQQLVPLNRYERFATLLERVSFRRARLVTTESEFAVQFLQQHFPKLTVHQAEHAPNPVFRQVQRMPQLSPIRFVSVGTPGFRKGTDLLLQALDVLTREFPFELRIFGTVEETYLASQQEVISDELRRRMLFQKNLSPAEVAAEMTTATILILPTRADTSPNAVKEAVVAGVPVVASAIGGIVDYVFPNQNGLLFPAGDLHSLIDALRTAHRHSLFSRGEVDPETLSRMRDYLSPQYMQERFFSAYRETLRLFGAA